MKYTVDTDAWTIEPADATSRPAPASWFEDDGFAMLSRWWLLASWQRKYSYQFRWLGRPIIQLPTDILMMQDLIHRIRPTLIIETGIAHGGSVVLHASILRLVHGMDSQKAGRPHVAAIDVEIRPQNRKALEEHPLRSMYTLIEGSSIDPAVVAKSRDIIQPGDIVMVVLDSNHTASHVAAELQAYAPLVSPGSALVVMDGVMRDLADLPGGEPGWQADNPCVAVDQFLQTALGREFSVDRTYDSFQFSHSPGGVLLRGRRSGAT